MVPRLAATCKRRCSGRRAERHIFTIRDLKVFHTVYLVAYRWVAMSDPVLNLDIDHCAIPAMKTIP